MMNVQGVFNSLVSLGATWVLWLLVGLSVAALAVALERWVFFRWTRDEVGVLRTLVNRAFSEGSLQESRRKLDERRSLEARMLSAGLMASNAAEAEERMLAEAGLQRLRGEQHLSFLGTLGNNAPFVGLLGTVVGIIGAFAELEAAGGQLTSGLMAEIGEALVATAVGLLVALPAVACYNAFQRTLATRLAQGDALSRELLAQFHAQPAEKLPNARSHSALTRRAS